MTKELIEALDRLSERIAIQEMTLNVIKEAADRLEEKLSLVMLEQSLEQLTFEVSDEDAEKIRNWIVND